MSLSLIFGAIVPTTHGASTPPTTTPTTTVAVAKPIIIIKPDLLDNKKVIVPAPKMNPELVAQLQSKKGGSIAFWEAVSWCETNHDWNNSGYYAGGLGIAQSAWRGYGGWEFAKSPKDATKEQQIIVANRLAFFGYQTKDVFKSLDDKINNRPWFRPPVRATSWGKNCVNWKTRKPYSLAFTEAAPPTTVAPAAVQITGLQGRVSAQSLNFSTEVKRCPQWEKKLKELGLPVEKFSYIMWRESRCQVGAIGWNYKNGLSFRNCKKAPAEVYKHCYAVSSYDSGLLQINSSWKTLTAQVCGSKYGDLAPLLTADCNLRVAKALYEDGGLAHWRATSGNA